MAKSKKAGGESIAKVDDAPPLGTAIAEDTLAAPRPSRKRAGDFSDFDGEKDERYGNTQSKETEIKPVKPKMRAKISSLASDATKPGKVVGQPVERAQTHPGGGVVKVEPTRTSDRYRGKGKRRETADDPPVASKSREKPSKSKKFKKTKLETPEEGKATIPKASTQAEEPGHTESKTKADKLNEVDKTASKSKSKSKGPVKDDSDANIKKKEIGEGTSNGKPKPNEASNDEAKVKSGKSNVTDEDISRAKAKSELPDRDDGKNIAQKSKETGDDASKAKSKSEHSRNEPKVNSKKSKVAPGKMDDEANNNILQANEEQPQVTASNNKTTLKSSETLDAAESSQPTKSRKIRNLKGPAEVINSSNTTTAGNVNNKDEKGKGVTKTETANPKKRKAPVNAGKDAVGALDSSIENASAEKKRKKSEPGATGNLIGGMLSSGLATAVQGVSAAKDYAADVANGAQNSIIRDVTQVAEAIVESNYIAKPHEKKFPKSKSKGKKQAKEAEMEFVEDSSKAFGIDAEDGVADAVADEDEEEAEEGHQSLALLKGFDSGDEDQFSGEEIFKEGQHVPQIPPKTAKKLKAAKEESDKPGVVYVGHIPHGFYEHEMRAYFSQFGPITRLRLSRNRKTGRSKHYAFIEFESAAVAKIVANTMDKYLLFGHILKCKFAPPEQLHPDVWKGANKRFKTVPWNKIEGRKLELPMGREGWERRIETEKKRREEKTKAMKGFGYEFEGGKLKGVNEVPVRKSIKEIDGAAEELIEEEKTVVVKNGEEEGTVVISEEISTTKITSGGKRRAKEAVGGPAASADKKTKGMKDVAQGQTAPAVKKVKHGKADVQERASSLLDEGQDVASASQGQTVAALETATSAIRQGAASSLEEVPKAISNVLYQAAPALNRAKRSKDKVKDETTSVAKKLADTIQDAAESKKAKKVKKGTSS